MLLRASQTLIPLIAGGGSMPGENYNIGHKRPDGFYYSTHSQKIFLESIIVRFNFLWQ